MKRSIQNDLALENDYYEWFVCGNCTNGTGTLPYFRQKTLTSNLSLFEIALCRGLQLVGKCGLRSHAMQNTDFVSTLSSAELENGKYLAKNFLSASIQC